MRKKKKGDGPDSIDSDQDCSTIFDTHLSGLDHAPFDADPGPYHTASGPGDALNIDYHSYHRPSHSRASLASSGIVDMDFGDISWTHPPVMSSAHGPGPLPLMDIPPSPASLDRGSISIPASLAGGGGGKAASSHAALLATTDRASSAQNKIVSKACGMVDELRKLYNLGVELDLLQLEEEVSAHLDAVEQLIHRSGRGSESRLGTIEDIGIT